jgi:arylsulfatase A-like enzyme
VHKVGYYTDLLSQRACDHLAQQSSSQPFLMSLHFTAPHWPWEGPQDQSVSDGLTDIFHYDGGTQATYGRMVESLDAAVGKVLATLEQRGLADNTIVIFTSDNGGERFSRTWPFSGQKTELLEGGLRIPAIIRWPLQLTPGSVNSQVAISMDWLPTLLTAAGGAPDPAYPSDGMDLLPFLKGSATPVDRTLYWRYHANTQRAIRSGNLKYLKINDNEFLFDVTLDPRERANLAKRQPAAFADLKAKWKAWDAGMLPIPAKGYSHGVTPAHQADHYSPRAKD